MPPNGGPWQRSLQAADSAGRLLDELGIDPTHQVDVFSMCEDLGLWLTFMTMDGLLGAFVPEGAGGVLITDRRPITVQRYTAAHELGHWRLEHGHGLALDGEEHVFGATPTERERLAQVFAASLLMPPPLVLSLLARIGIGDHGHVGAKEAYFVAREAGVSYEASVRQLSNLQVITRSEATALLQVRPLTVKSELAGGRRPVSGYADVWPVDEAWNDMLLSLRADDEVVVSLPENRSTGYRWLLEDEAVEVSPAPEPPPLSDRTDASAPGDVSPFLEAVRTAKPGRAPRAALQRLRHIPAPTVNARGERALAGGVTVVGDDYVPGRGPRLQPSEARRFRLAIAAGEHPPSGTQEVGRQSATKDRGHVGRDTDPLVAATGRRLLGFRFATPGPKTLRLRHCSPYSSSPPIEEYVLHAVVEPRRHGFSIDQLVDDPQESWVSEVRDRQLRQSVSAIGDPGQG
jgi:Zn-dependent peptidase ImmA (M78 family)/predicted secreted protein